MATPVDQLTVSDFEQARSNFDQAREDYDELRSYAEEQSNLHEDQGDERSEIFNTLSEYYRLMMEASAFGYQGVDALLDEEDVLDAFSRSASAFEMLEETYDDAQDIRKKITLYRDTTDAEIEDLVSTWISENEDDILEANNTFEEATTEFNTRNYTTARETFISSAEIYQGLLDDINSQFATKYPQDSELYQLYGDISYFINQMLSSSESLANSARLRSEGDFEEAVGYENDAQEAHPEGVQALQSARDDISILDERFDPPELPEFEQQESVESREQALEVIEQWLNDNENTIQAQSNYLATANDEYDSERYEDAADWYRTVGEEWGELEQNATEQADQYEHQFTAETFTLLSDYFGALRNHTEAMEQAASARTADLDGEAREWENDAQEYQEEAEELGTRIDERLADEDVQ